jgi:acetylornithine deacetylase
LRSAIEERVKQSIASSIGADLDLLRSMMRASQDGEARIQQVVASELEALGCTIDVFEADLDALRSHPAFTLVSDLERIGTKDRPNVVGVLQGSGAGRSLFAFAHVDSYELQLATWSVDPYDLTIVDDQRAYGYGVCDDRSGVAAMLLALRALKSCGIELQGDVVIVSCLGKHFGTGGTLAVIERGYAGDGAVYLHPAETGRGLQDFKASTLGLVQFSISIAGAAPDYPEKLETPAAHLGINAIEKAYLVMERLQAWSDEVAASHTSAQVTAEVGRSTNVLISSIQGGRGERKVPVSCRFDGSITFPPGLSVTEVREAVEAEIAQCAAADPWLSANPPQLTWLPGFATPAETALSSPFVVEFVGAVADASGRPPRSWPCHTASDIRFPAAYSGSPTVGFGPRGGGFGGPDEWLDLTEFQQAITALALLMVRWCGVSSPVDSLSTAEAST